MDGTFEKIPQRFVLLPGLHGTADLFDRFIAAAPESACLRVVTYPTDRCLGWNQLHQHVASELAGEPPVVLIAESFGGPLALRFAADHPDEVRAVILCASFVSPPVPRPLCYLATPLIWTFFPIPGLAIRAFLSGMRADARLVTQVRQAIRANPPRVLAHRVRIAAGTNARNSLRKCQSPILYLAAAHDRLVGARSRRRIGRIRPAIETQFMETPHLLLQTRPEEAWRRIRQFLGELPPTQAAPNQNS